MNCCSFLIAGGAEGVGVTAARRRLMYSHVFRALAPHSSPARGSLANWLSIGFLVLIAFIARLQLRAEDRSYDGTGNNLANPLWGSAGTDYLREASGAHYADGIWTPVVAGLPSARAV